MEGALPDGKTGRIQDEHLIPYFQQGIMTWGVNTYNALLQEVCREYGLTFNPIQGGPETAVPEPEQGFTREELIEIILILALILIFGRRALLRAFGGAVSVVSAAVAAPVAAVASAVARLRWGRGAAALAAEKGLVPMLQNC